VESVREIEAEGGDDHESENHGSLSHTQMVPSRILEQQSR